MALLGPAVVHLISHWNRLDRTECCNLMREELPEGDWVTAIPDRTTCEVTAVAQINLIVDREAALNRRAQEALPRLLMLRARINRASSSELNADFRDELLKLIDWGQNGHT
jgi:hypothetical protein